MAYHHHRKFWFRVVASCLGIVFSLTAEGQTKAQELPLIVEDVSAYGCRVVIGLEGAVFQTGKEGERLPKGLQMTLDYFKGKWKEGVGGSAGSLNQGTHHGKVTDFSEEGMKVKVTMNVGSDRWVKGDPAATYQLTFTQFGGVDVAGTYTGLFQGKEVKGNFSGKAQLPGFNKEQVSEGSMNIEFNLGTRIQNWNAARWRPYGMPRGVNVADFDHLELVVETDAHRHDAWLDLGMMEEDGSWYIVRDAIPLSSKKRTVTVPLGAARHAEWIFNATGTGAGSEGNFDENSFLNLDQVTRMAFGTVNGHGVGEVKARIRDLKLVQRKGEPRELVHDVVVEGKGLSFNGQEEIPVGIFGFHIAGGRPEDVAELRPGSIRWIQAMGWGGSYVREPRPEIGLDIVVASQYDRKQQLPQANHKAKGDWREISKKIGQSLGNSSKPHGDKILVEWWNEPYLDLGMMLEKSMSSMKAPEGTKAGDPVGGKFNEMIWAPQDKLWHYRYYDKQKENLPKGEGKLVPIDPRRFSYWSGPQISEFYNQTYLLVAEEAKKINPDLQMIWSLGFRWHEDDWISWKLVHQPYIDKAIEFVDGVGEHHYQGYTDGMVGAYEVLATYGQVRHGKKLYSVNTEANDLWDAPARGNVAALGQKNRFVARKRLVYNLRDILGVLKWSPDKLKARAIHALWSGAKDARRKFDEKLPYGKNMEVTAKGVEYVDAFSYRDGKEKKELKASEGKVLAVVTFSAKSTNPKRGGTLVLSDLQMEVTSEGQEKKAFKMSAWDTNGTHKRKKYKLFSTPKGESREVHAIFEMDEPGKGDVVELVKKGKGYYKVHLSGPFKPFKVDPWRSMGINKGEYLALKFLADLRGQMVETQVTNNEGEVHPNIWSISSLDEKTQSLVTVAYNESSQKRQVRLKLKAPKGSEFTKGTLEKLVHDETGKVDLMEEEISFTKTTAEVTVELAPAHAVKLAMGLNRLPTLDVVEATQFHAGDPKDPDGGIIKEIAPGQSLSLPIDIPGGEIQSARSARVRLVLELVAEGDGIVKLGKKSFPVPVAHTPNNGPYVREFDVEPALLKGVDALVFQGNPGDQGNGFRLCAASVILEQDPTD